MCFGICHDHFLTFFSWNSTDSLDGAGKLLCSCLLQSPGFVPSVLNKYYKQEVTYIHPSFPLLAVELDTYMLQGVLTNAQAPTYSLSISKCLWGQCSCRYNVTASHGLSLSFPLLQERRYQLTLIYDVIAWLLLVEVLVLFYKGFILSGPMQVALWFHQNSLTCVYIKQTNKQ